MPDARRDRRPSLMRGALFHYVRLLLNGNRVLHEVKAALAARPEERVLDFGCGCGGFCLAVPGEYLGIDLNPNCIAFARWRWGRSSRRFELVELEALDPHARFDGVMMVSCLHHLSDAEAHAVLGRLARIVRRRLVVVDLDPESSNRFQAFLLAHDRGRFIRPAARQRELLGAHFMIAEERRFQTTTRSTPQTLFVCEPRPAAAT
jgi:2-polyprenyl-3-methyl-5-hydroxy-6-metoxy-1,4-benzoquinol methylase